MFAVGFEQVRLVRGSYPAPNTEAVAELFQFALGPNSAMTQHGAESSLPLVDFDDRLERSFQIVDVFLVSNAAA